MIYLIIFITILIFLVYILFENANPMVDTYIIERDLPSSIKQLNLLHISDLHNYKFGVKQSKIKKIIKNNYDLIFITGDIIDRRYIGHENAMDLIDLLNGNIFFVTGNHEKGYKDFDKLRKMMISKGVKILDDEVISYKGIDILGINDPSEYISLNKKVKKNTRKEIDEKLSSIIKKSKNDFRILLVHRPEFFDIYAKYNINLIFSGHTHGGQVRIFNKGVFSSGQGFFGKYCGGIFTKKDSVMYNSRGLGNNFPFAKRVFNRPQIIEVIIKNTNSN
ncbi:metallophosphoesterase [Helcococcus ovis]|uniref:Metallophosphoesterase n=1 Tax=Helcococcus ovis TaxID=72026 RepID=A0A4R9C2F6_9FIRM|nr:metallophosphoesterase [Helcococcus ovis]TFF64085.1 metallophosphoesterase [Helcococcus ovis]TFF64982.1 metallophosphoesterase [Helcococcus ovis]